MLRLHKYPLRMTAYIAMEVEEQIIDRQVLQPPMHLGERTDPVWCSIITQGVLVYPAYFNLQMVI